LPSANAASFSDDGTADVIDSRNYLVTETLKDGTAVTIRAIRPADSGRVLEAFKNLDPASIYTRFFHYKRKLTEAELQQITDVDFDHVVALVVSIRSRDGETIIAEGRYIVDDAPRPCRSAEVAFITEEDYQGRGIARLLLRHLVRIARKIACRALRPTCSQATNRCSPSFDAVAYRCNSAATGM
jgi:GNAT superfamily N-acetyltransferase